MPVLFYPRYVFTPLAFVVMNCRSDVERIDYRVAYLFGFRLAMWGLRFR